MTSDEASDQHNLEESKRATWNRIPKWTSSAVDDIPYCTQAQDEVNRVLLFFIIVFLLIIFVLLSGDHEKQHERQ